jgi:uncharacterized protein YdaU (DUF1376 family)
MTQNRKPPAYQEYAATILADRNFRLMTLAERGLFFSMRLECWQNGEVPAIDNDLAKYLGYEVSEIKIALTSRVKSFFMLNDSSFNSPELEDYRQHLDERKTKQSEGGRRGAAIVNGKSNKPAKRTSASDLAISSGDLQVPRRGNVGSLVKPSTEKQSQTQPLENGNNQDVWITDYERASKGE